MASTLMNTGKIVTIALLLAGAAVSPAGAASKAWKVGQPIVTYWCGPGMTDATAKQMAEGGFNLVWCSERELAVAARHGLRALLTDPLLAPATLDDPAQRAKLEALVTRVRTNSCFYAYFITDEPNAAAFPALGRLVAYLREHDPAHLAYINLFPTYANNDQLGNRGDKITAYNEHLRQYLGKVQPALISYDHYQFTTNGDSPDYFLNLALIRQAALGAQLPFLNIVQACSWTPSIRVPTSDEVRYLVYTTLAYGAQGISYYIYSCPGHRGGIANADGSPTELYAPLSQMNREFAAIASELQQLSSLGVYHAGMQPPGTETLPTNSVFQLDPPLAPFAYHPPERVRGLMLGVFGPAPKRGKVAAPTHALVVNLDYRSEVTAGIGGPKRLQVFDPVTRKWKKSGSKRIDLQLGPGEGKLLRF